MEFNVCSIPRYDRNQNYGKAHKEIVNAVPRSSVCIACGKQGTETCVEREDKMKD